MVYSALSNKNAQHLLSFISLDTGSEQLKGFGLVQVCEYFVGKLVSVQLLRRYTYDPPIGPEICTIANRRLMQIALLIDFEHPLRPAR
ncbi:hypothetical protein D3C77_650390 [compost metagenome]